MTRRNPPDAVGHPDPQFTVDEGSGEPLYRQIVAYVRRRVAGGQLKVGDELPSVRTLARSLGINPMTASKALGVLEAEGILTRRRGKTMVVSESILREQAAVDRVHLLRPTLERAALEAIQLQLPASQALALYRAILDEQLAMVRDRLPRVSAR